jgi:glycosyltransferase involved in cell wall biosynthesis
LLRGAARVHCTAEGELEQAAKWLPPGKGVVLPLIIDLSAFATLPGPELARARLAPLRGAGPTLLFLSRVHPKKGVEVLIRAAAELARRGRACRVVIAGPGEAAYVDQLRALAAACGLGETVAFAGMVRGAEKLSLYEAADVFVLPTSQENFGLVLLEALACRTPVVTTRGVDIWKELEQAGAVIVDATPDAIAAGVERALADGSLGERGRRWVSVEMDAGRLAGRYHAFYRQVVDEARDRRK